MYRGLRLDSDIEIYEVFVHQVNTNRSLDIKAVEKMIMSGQPINVAKIENYLFREGKPDAFLLHSFQDRNIALEFAAALRSIGLSAVKTYVTTSNNGACK